MEDALGQKHEIKPDAQRFAAGGFCVACGRDQHTRAQLLYHLRYSSRRCLDTLTQIMQPFDDTEVTELKRQQAEEDARLRDSGYKPEKALCHVDDKQGRGSTDLEAGVTEEALSQRGRQGSTRCITTTSSLLSTRPRCT